MIGSVDIDETDRELANPNFEPTAFVNNLIPDEKSLENIAQTHRDLLIRSRKISNTIREAVHDYSVLGDRSDAILDETRESIKDLEKRIQQIHKQAMETQKVVQDICGGIKPLDNAKRNLTTSVTTLRHYQMMVAVLNEFVSNVADSRYVECTHNIQALSEFLDRYKKYENHQRLKPIIGRFYDQKRMLRGKVNLVLEDVFNKGTADASNIPICNLITAFDDGFQNETIEMFCERWLSMYDDTFANAELNSMKNRFNWFKQRLEFFNKQMIEGFPKEWRMQYHLTRVFCRKTYGHLHEILCSKEPSVKEYLQAFELTVKFENKMAQSFTTQVEIPFDPNAPMPEFSSDADGVRAKYEWLQRQRDQVSETKLVPADEFKGTIASAFAPHLALYLESEKKNILKLINEGTSSARKDMDSDEHILGSATTVVLAMKATIDKCAGFGVDQSLLDLFVNLKELLGKYVSGLTAVLPKKPSKDEDFQLMCCVSNTSAFVLSIVDSLAQKIGEIVSEELRPGIVVDDVKDNIGVELKKQLVFFVDVFIKENDQSLAKIGSNSWSGDAGDRLPRKLMDSFESRFGVAVRWMSSDNLNRLRPTLVSGILGAVRESFFNQQRISLEQASGLSSSLKELKSTILTYTRGDSSIVQKRTNADFAALENEVTIVISPEVAMAQVYLTKVKKPSKKHFMELVRLKGLRGNEEQDAMKALEEEAAAMGLPI